MSNHTRKYIPHPGLIHKLLHPLRALLLQTATNIVQGSFEPVFCPTLEDI